MGKCLLCSSSFDDYSSRWRCFHCRMLVLVCSDCQGKGVVCVCELCQKSGKGVKSISLAENCKTEVVSRQTKEAPEFFLQFSYRNGITLRRKLRILCMHGFRQNASSFKGRTASLAKKLKNIAELVFIDAPHEVPFIYQPRTKEADEISTPPDNCGRKFAWLVGSSSNGNTETYWKIADEPFDGLQYERQTSGFDKSLEYLKKVFLEKGPFDGILGFSQGAAIAASICALHESVRGEMVFRFAVLCSGFAIRSLECKPGSINVPSLHVFGSNPGKDRQITTQTSRELASLFEKGCSVIIEHDCGHIIPTRSPYIDQIRDFLSRFM